MTLWGEGKSSNNDVTNTIQYPKYCGATAPHFWLTLNEGGTNLISIKRIGAFFI